MKYERPYTLDQIKEKYPRKIYEKLSSDPVHRWRAETGIELIHKEPDFDEQIRIWKNWNLMNDKAKQISDEKSLELFGISNAEHHQQIMNELYPNRKFDILYERIMTDLGNVMLLPGPENWNDSHFENPYVFKTIKRNIDFKNILDKFKQNDILYEDKHQEFAFGNKIIGFIKGKLFNYINEIDTDKMKDLASRNWIHFKDFYEADLTQLFIYKCSFSKIEDCADYVLKFIGSKIDSSYHEIIRTNILNCRNTSGFCLPLGFCYILIFNSDIKISDETLTHEFCHYVDLELNIDFSNFDNEIESLNEKDDYFKYLNLNENIVSYLKNKHEFYVNIYFNLFKNLQKIFWLRKEDNWFNFIEKISKDIKINDFYKSDILNDWNNHHCNNTFLLKALFALNKYNENFFNNVIDKLKNQKLDN